LSELLGYSSIACWLGAQFPQILENIRQQSCDGLALPFLANWLLGDISNLIGCIILHQLPFQTWLATYFVVVDCTLVVQYLYYRRNSKEPVRSITERPITPRYRTLSAVAANVAAAAALAAQQDEQRHQRRTSFSEEDDIPTDLTESFHSDIGGKRVTWSIERTGGRGASLGRLNLTSPLPLTSPEGDILASRGRSLRPGSTDNPLSASTGTLRPSSHASHRGAGMVFLAVWALFGVGTLMGSLSGPAGATGTGRVLAVRDAYSRVEVTPVVPLDLRYSGSDDMSVSLHEHDAAFDLPDNFRITETSSQKTTGRIFAWLCTILYLTSRLPQIWKNFVRKSVEGLSMYLFVFAFLGNTFYVASVLATPQAHGSPAESLAFIKESIPYLLGSGGTLMFDITIVVQSFLYRGRRHRSPSKSRSVRHIPSGRPTSTGRLLDDEERGLLAADFLSH
ncbi:hypothetical protein FISHEDRAFT_23981, partial [Fistulina hepatica ATCC 64428]